MNNTDIDSTQLNWMFFTRRETEVEFSERNLIGKNLAVRYSVLIFILCTPRKSL